MSARHDIDPALTIAAPGASYSASQIDLARRLSSSTLHEAGGRIGAFPRAIKPVTPSFRVAGPALTVHSPPGDNLWLHRAIYAARPGDVMVVYCDGVHDHGYWGEIMSSAAQVRRLGGLVIDACVRDRLQLETVGFPVFARGLCIRGTGKDFGARGFINHPILIEGLIVSPGDLIIGDADGVVSIPARRVDDVLSAAQRRDADEARILERLAAGERTLDIYGWNA